MQSSAILLFGILSLVRHHGVRFHCCWLFPFFMVRVVLRSHGPAPVATSYSQPPNASRSIHADSEIKRISVYHMRVYILYTSIKSVVLYIYVLAFNIISLDEIPRPFSFSPTRPLVNESLNAFGESVSRLPIQRSPQCALWEHGSYIYTTFNYY